MEVNIKTLTPLWTGGVEAGKCDRIHETGILGSLRWWMEVLVRGVGGNACDPTEQKCLYDPKKPNNGLCDVCKVFGATGWKRRFRLSVNVDDEQSKTVWQPSVPLRITPFDRTRGWFLNPGWLGTLQIKIQGDPETLVELYILLRFIETWGNIGARPQLGYGAFRIIDIKDPPPAACYAIYGDRSPSDQPDLRTFTFFKLRFTTKTATWWQTVPGIRELRGKLDKKREWSELEQLAKHGMVPTTPALKIIFAIIINGHPRTYPIGFSVQFGRETIASAVKLPSVGHIAWILQMSGRFEVGCICLKITMDAPSSERF
ncbi:MAG: type III-B CRISPR module RAMP protein Cmr1 [Cyanobacteria bacterium CRU_2_1]|nr:type III-B CRISPR module RAMP protein Cmr1 [Cyanobacteria bacterium CRU_2_1]